MEDNVANGVLNIPTIQANQSGKYQCVGKNDAGNETVDIQVDVLFAPREFNVSMATGEYITHELYEKRYSDLRLKCEAQGFPTPMVYWEAIDPKKSIVKTNILSIISLDFDSTGWYRCVANNSVASNDFKLKLKVIDQPRLASTLDPVRPDDKRKQEQISILDSIPKPESNSTLEYEKYFMLKTGESVGLNCCSTGSPKPKTSWYKNNVELIGSRGNQIEYLQDVSIEDIGIYECRQINFYGTLSVFYYVDVQSNFVDILIFPL